MRTNGVGAPGVPPAASATAIAGALFLAYGKRKEMLQRLKLIIGELRTS